MNQKQLIKKPLLIIKKVGAIKVLIAIQMNFTYSLNGLTMQNLISSNYPQIIEKLFKQVNTSIRNLLQYLNSLYQTHGINFSVIPFHGYLTRILTPFQLLSKLGIIDVSPMLIKNTQNKSHNKFFNTNFNHDAPNLQPNVRNNLSKGYPQIGAVKTIQRQQKFGFGNRPFLEREQQQQVIRFMEDKYQKGIAITLQMISDYARQLGNNKYFIASSGWAKNFLKRHPEMKQLYHRSREQKKESSSFQYENTLHKQLKYLSNYNQLIENRKNIDSRNPSQQNFSASAFQDWNIYPDYYSNIKVQASQKRNGNGMQNGQINKQKTGNKFIYNNSSLFQNKIQTQQDTKKIQHKIKNKILKEGQQKSLQIFQEARDQLSKSGDISHQEGQQTNKAATNKNGNVQSNIYKKGQKIENQNSRVPSKSFKVKNIGNVSNY